MPLHLVFQTQKFDVSLINLFSPKVANANVLSMLLGWQNLKIAI